MNGIWKGVLLGAANVVVIGIAMAAFDLGVDESDRGFDAGIALLVMMFGGLPGMVVGAGLGVIGLVMERSPIVLRIPALALPAIGLVYLLAHEFQMMHLALVSCIPTVVAALILERWTRKPADPPPVPVAKVMT